MSDKCMHRLSDGSFCKRYASQGTSFCSHHQGSYAHLQHSNPVDIHPLARLTTPEDVFDLVRETLNATRLGRISPAQAYAVGYLAAEWRKAYNELSMRQRMTALHRQILPDLMIDETQAEAERAEAPHPLPIHVDEGATVAHMIHPNNPAVPPLEHVSTYPGWIEQEGRRKGDRPDARHSSLATGSEAEGSKIPTAAEGQSAPAPPPPPVEVSPAPARPRTLSAVEGSGPVNGSGKKAHPSPRPHD